MVRLTFHPVSAAKDCKETSERIIISELEQDQQKIDDCKSKPFMLRYLWIGLSMVVILLGLLLGSILTYRYFFISRLLEGGTLFHCNVIYSDGFTSDRMEFSEAVRILLEQRGQFISVPVPNFGKGDAADIVHDFRKNLTAYWDKELDNCYISELDTAHVPAPENLLDLLSKVEKGMYFPHNYMIREELVVTGRTKNLGSPIMDEMCHNKDTYLLAKRRKSSRASRKRRSREDCRIIHHFESPYLMETVICS